jgi:hypothetical protein
LTTLVGNSHDANDALALNAQPILIPAEHASCIGPAAVTDNTKTFTRILAKEPGLPGGVRNSNNADDALAL